MNIYESKAPIEWAADRPFSLASGEATRVLLDGETRSPANAGVQRHRQRYWIPALGYARLRLRRVTILLDRYQP